VVIPKAATLVRLLIVLNPPLPLVPSLVTLSKEVGSDFVLPVERALNKRLQVTSKEVTSKVATRNKGATSSSQATNKEAAALAAIDAFPLQS